MQSVSGLSMNQRLLKGSMQSSSQAAVTSVDANMLRRVRENAARRTAVCLETETASNAYLTTRRP
jgi:hypothetical protein